MAYALHVPGSKYRRMRTTWLLRAGIFFICLLFSAVSTAQWRVGSFKEKDGLRGFHFTQVLSDKENRLWAVSTGGLQRFDGGRFRSIANSNPGLYLLPLRDGSMVYTTRTGELHRLKLSGHRRHDSLLARLPAGEYLLSDMCEDDAGRIWLCTSSGLCVYTPGHAALTMKHVCGAYGALLPQAGGILLACNEGIFRLRGDELLPVEKTVDGLSGFCVDAGGTLWITAQDTLLLSLSPSGAITRRADLHRFDSKLVFTAKPVADGNGGIILGTLNGVLRYDIASGTLARPEWFDEQFQAVPYCAVYSCCLTAPGVLWCGTWRGLLRLSLNLPGITGIRLPRLRSIAAAGNDTIFSGASNCSVYRSVREGKSWRTELFLERPVTQLNVVNVMHRDRRGRLWLGRNGTLLCTDPRGGTVREYPPLCVWSIREDKNGCLWFGSSVGSLWRLQPHADTCESIPLQVKGHSLKVYDMFVEDEVLLLAASDGIHYLDMRILKPDTGRPELAALLAVTHDQCWGISRGRNGMYYIGAQYDGLLAFNPQSGRSERMSESGLSVYALRTDKLGQCWAVTEKGLLQLNGEGGFRYYDERDGLISSDLSFVGIALLPGNGVAVAGANGLSLVEPQGPDNAYALSRLLIDRVEAGGSVLAEDLDNGAGIEIDHLEQGINIHLCMPDDRFPERYLYRYRVNGDSAWSAWTESPVLSFASFAPGDYRLYFEGRSSGGFRSSGTLLMISVPPPFWRTGYFYSLLGVTGLGLLMLGIRLRIRALRRHYKMKHVLLESQNKALRMQMNPHFVFNALNAIQYYMSRHDSEMAGHYLGRFAELIRSTLDYAQTDLITLEEELDFLRRYLEIEQLRFGERFRYTMECDPALPADTRVPVMLIQPLIENAIVHGIAGLPQGGALTVRFRARGDLFLCEVINDGAGKTERPARAKRHVSRSLQLIRERLRHLTRDQRALLRLNELTDAAGRSCGMHVELQFPFL